MEPNDYEVLLIVAGLASLLLVIAGLASYTRSGLAIKPTAWRKFLGGHQFAAHNCAIELEQKRWGAVARALAVAKVAAMART